MTTFLPVGPLRDAILRDREYALEHYTLHAPPNDKGWYALAAWSGTPERSLRRVAQENTVVSLDLADAYCCGTGRHLRDLYPELYAHDEGFPADCRKCRASVDHDILAEGAKRMYLRCRDCGTTHYLQRSPQKPNRTSYPQFVPVDSAVIVAAYESGMTLREVANAYGFRSETAVKRRILRAGGTLRRRGTRDRDVMLAQLRRGQVTRAQNARKRLRRITDRWNEGMTGPQIAAELGLKIHAVYDAIHHHPDLVTRHVWNRKRVGANT